MSHHSLKRNGGDLFQEPLELETQRQKILVFQQNGSGEGKIKGIRLYGRNLFVIETFSIDSPLPPIIDDAHEYLPEDLDASLVLDFLKHPDLSEDLASLCRKHSVPMVASGKKLRTEGVITPPT